MTIAETSSNTSYKFSRSIRVFLQTIISLLRRKKHHLLKMHDSNISLVDIYRNYSLTYLSIKDLYPYEIAILIIYGIMIIFSFFTNLIAIIIFSFGHRSRSEFSPFLLNLSVFNIIMTVYCIPFTIISLIFQRWLFARELCIVLDGFKTFSVSGVSLTMIAIAIDRYFAVRYPLAMKIYSNYKRNCMVLIIIWLLSIGLALIWTPARPHPIEESRLWVSSRSVFQHYIGSIENISNISHLDHLIAELNYRVVNTTQCVPDNQEPITQIKRSILNSLQTYFLPLFILAFFYFRIATLLWYRTNRAHSSFFTGVITSASTVRNNSFIHESVGFKKKLKQVILCEFSLIN